MEAGDDPEMLDTVQDIDMAYHDGKDLNVASSSVGIIGSEARTPDPTGREEIMAGEKGSLAGAGGKDGLMRASGPGEDFGSTKGGTGANPDLMADHGLIPERQEDLFGDDTTTAESGNLKSSDGNLRSTTDASNETDGHGGAGLEEVGGYEADDVSERHSYEI